MRDIECFDVYGKLHRFPETAFISRPAAYGVLMKDDGILLVKEKWNGTWGLPGGGIEKDETPIESVIREFREETGLIIREDVRELFTEESYFKPEGEPAPWKTHSTVYEVTSIGGELRSRGNDVEVSAVDYLSIERVKEIAFKQQHSSILQKVLNSF